MRVKAQHCRRRLDSCPHQIKRQRTVRRHRRGKGTGQSQSRVEDLVFIGVEMKECSFGETALPHLPRRLGAPEEPRDPGGGTDRESEREQDRRGRRDSIGGDSHGLSANR